MTSSITENLRRFRLPLFCAFAFALATTLSFLTIKNLDKTAAADLSRFNAGDIMSDGVMANYTSMNEGQIQSFLKSKNSCNNTNVWVPSNGRTTGSLDMGGTMNWHVENGHFVCMADERFDGESAAHIIWQAAQDYKINPQVLIVLLEKEQGLVTDTRPRSGQYRAATGYGCPDTAACDSQYYGFRNQVRNAASLFRWILDHGSKYKPVGDNYIQYSPNSACGGSIVNIKNRATSALYQYTPYQPNAGALAAGYGTASCGAYGNRNFYAYFTDWFGDTHQATGAGYVYERHEQLGGDKGILGKATATINCNIGRAGACVQAYENGIIVYSPQTGAWESYGNIRAKHIALGSVDGTLGYPVSAVNCNIGHNGACVQAYEKNGVIISSKLGTFESHGRLRTRHVQVGSIDGKLGLPTSGVNKVGNFFTQDFENGKIVANDRTGTWETYGKTRERYEQLGGINSSVLGLPISAVNCNIGRKDACVQAFEGNKVIIYSPTTGAWESYGPIRSRMLELGGVDEFGYPISAVNCNIGRKDACVQAFEGNKVVIYSPTTGAWENYGEIRAEYLKNKGVGGELGYPTGAISTSGSTTEQNYENGTIKIDL